MKTHRILFQPMGQRGIFPEGTSILEAARRLNIGLLNVCGGNGTCGHCKVQVVSGAVSDRTQEEEQFLSPEEIESGFRLACRTIPLEDTTLQVPAEPLSAPQRTQVECRIAYPSGIGMAAFNPSAPMGLAMDLGTTKIALFLVDLETGETLASQGWMNPQIKYGEDVISRIALSDHDQRMQKTVVNELNSWIQKITKDIGRHPEDIQQAVAVGNTAMHHLFLNLPVSQLAKAPYVPAIKSEVNIKAREVGLKLAENAILHLPPLIGGFIGSDHVAAILASDHQQSTGTRLILDIGTNTEISLVAPGFISSVSCASGPAFEGAHIRHGMRGAEGAMEHVRINNCQVDVQTIGDIPPTGICGSGILDAVSQLLENGIIDKTGVMKDPGRTRIRNNEREFVLFSGDGANGTRDITLTQKDVREVQLAKAAIQTGIKALLQNHHLTVKELSQVLVAGAFGNYIDLESAKAIGLLPMLPSSRFVQMGNAAGAGARMILVSALERKKSLEIAAKATLLELAVKPDFRKLFMESLVLEPYASSVGVNTP